MDGVTVTDKKVVSLAPKIKHAEIRALLPTVLTPLKASFVIHGVSNAVSNGIRRTIGGELRVSAMFAEYASMETNDPILIPEMVLLRLRMIPIDQKIDLNAKFELIATNTTDTVRDVKSSEIMRLGESKAKPVFNETFTICTLAPGMSISISPIIIRQEFGFTSGDGMHVVAVQTVSRAVDQKPINTFEPEAGGLSSRVANPRVWEIIFKTIGTMTPDEIIRAACDSIIDRVSKVKALLYSIVNNADEYLLTINGESDTIGNLFMRTICDLYPDITAVAYSCESVGRGVTIRVRCDDDINTIFLTTIKKIVSQMEQIRQYF